MNHAEEWRNVGQRVGQRVLLHELVESTNALALALAHHPEHDGLVLLTREQTAGRGQHGRTWTAPPGSSVLLSALLFPPPSVCRPALLTAWAAVSVCETVRDLTGIEATIKWPNDVLIGGRKVCGILIEQRVGTVAGIGLNLNQGEEHFQMAGLIEATSLAIDTGQEFDFREVARRLIQCLDTWYGRLIDGDLASLESSWRERLGLSGRVVIAECHEGTVTGWLRELSFAAIVLETEGTVRRLLPEVIRHLRTELAP
jgi:BirA family transcriptional regulator, biotin operon repressor / biotin---[acetyl-CoA-carboxylase] ligase